MAQRTPRWHSLLRGKPVDAFVNETRPDAEGGELSRSIGLFQLTMIGVGATIGTGIFSSVVRRYGPRYTLRRGRAPRGHRAYRSSGALVPSSGVVNKGGARGSPTARSPRASQRK